MYANGVSHLVVNDELRGVHQLLNWLAFVPATNRLQVSRSRSICCGCVSLNSRSSRRCWTCLIHWNVQLRGRQTASHTTRVIYWLAWKMSTGEKQ